MALFGRPSENDDARAAAYRQWFARQHPLALASLLLSLFSLTPFGTTATATAPRAGGGHSPGRASPSGW
jgi:hypothetical protein